MISNTESNIFNPKKHYLNINVYEAAKKRIKIIFDEFHQIYISFSGGKDSGIMIYLVLEEAKFRNRKISILFIDLEAQYKLTIDFIESIIFDEEFKQYIDQIFWICLPINLTNAVSTFEPKWMCWDDSKKKLWVRSMPIHDCVVNKENIPEEWNVWFKERMEFEEFIVDFGKWFASGKKTACGIGIRTDESLRRFAALQKNHEKYMYNNFKWTAKLRNDLYNFFPIYDWKSEDIWTAVGKFNWKYNKLYDYMYMAGKTLNNSRICQPYGSDQRQGLDLFRKIEPLTWEKVVYRVSGVNTGNIYVCSNLLGDKKLQLPKHFHTWKNYAEFLLETIPKYQAHIYRERITMFKKYWQEVEFWEGEMLDANPNSKDFIRKRMSALYPTQTLKKFPTWERICKMILKNDLNAKTLSYSSVLGGYKRVLALKFQYNEEDAI
jgi:predicted phosphoadenosine phosphosulfate sulfurtransferase